MARAPRFHCCGLGSIPGWGTEIPQAVRHGQKKKKKSRGPNGALAQGVVCWSLHPPPPPGEFLSLPCLPGVNRGPLLHSHRSVCSPVSSVNTPCPGAWVRAAFPAAPGTAPAISSSCQPDRGWGPAFPVPQLRGPSGGPDTGRAGSSGTWGSSPCDLGRAEGFGVCGPRPASWHLGVAGVAAQQHPDRGRPWPWRVAQKFQPPPRPPPFWGSEPLNPFLSAEGEGQ